MCREIVWFQQTAAVPESSCDAILDGMVQEAGSESIVGGGDKRQKIDSFGCIHARSIQTRPQKPIIKLCK